MTTEAYKSNGDSVIVFEEGYVSFINRARQPHRLCGPAYISPNGHIRYNKNGNIHRPDGPAFIGRNERRYYIRDKELTLEEYFFKYGRI